MHAVSAQRVHLAVHLVFVVRASRRITPLQRVLIPASLLNLVKNLFRPRFRPCCATPEPLGVPREIVRRVVTWSTRFPKVQLHA